MSRILGWAYAGLAFIKSHWYSLTNRQNRTDYFQYMGCDSVSTSTDMSLSTRDDLAANPLWARDDVSDAELEVRLNNYTTQDLAYSQQLAADGSAN